MNYKEDSFLIRTYTKAELAHLYNPHVCLKVALQILRRWELQASFHYKRDGGDDDDGVRGIG